MVRYGACLALRLSVPARLAGRQVRSGSRSCRRAGRLVHDSSRKIVMPPYITRPTANALMQLGAKANASARDPILPKDAVPPADPTLEPDFTPLEETLGERPPGVPPPVSSARPEPQLNLPTMSDVRNRMQQMASGDS